MRFMGAKSVDGWGVGTRCCVRGVLLEVNERLIKAPGLLNTQVLKAPGLLNTQPTCA
jgi:glycine cleavage system H lipoate-binding protein